MERYGESDPNEKFSVFSSFIVSKWDTMIDEKDSKAINQQKVSTFLA